MQLAYAPGSLAVSGYCNLFNGGTLSIYSGSDPGPEAAPTGTLLCSWTFSSPAFTGVVTQNSGGFDFYTASFSSTSSTPVASGTAGYARATMATPVARANTTAYARGALVTASSLLWVCTAAGTTSGTSTLTANGYGVLDGTAAFDVVGPSSASTTLADFTVGTSGTDVVLGSTSINTGTTVTISSFKIQAAIA